MLDKYWCFVNNSICLKREIFSNLLDQSWYFVNNLIYLKASALLRACILWNYLYYSLLNINEKLFQYSFVTILFLYNKIYHSIIHNFWDNFTQLTICRFSSILAVFRVGCATVLVYSIFDYIFKHIVWVQVIYNWKIKRVSIQFEWQSYLTENGFKGRNWIVEKNLARIWNWWARVHSQ